MKVPQSQGLNVSEFKKIKIQMLTYGTCNPEILKRLNDYQRYWINETKKTLRDLSKS